MGPGAMLLVRTDASAQMGAGHFMRCLALTQVWKENGGTVTFLMATGTPALAKRLQQENTGGIYLSAQPGSMADADETASIALQHDADWIALDGYQFSSAYQRRLKDKTKYLLLFDDLADADLYYADLLLNQNAYATPKMYANRTHKCTLLLGAPNLLLRREFRSVRHRERSIAPNIRNLLVTLGGTDPANATSKVLQALAKLPAPTMSVKVLVGGDNPYRNELEDLATSSSHNVEFQVDSQQMATEMAWADLAISAAGSTSWELAYMGLPSLLITIAENQRGCADFLQQHGIAVSLGWHRDLQPSEITSALGELAGNYSKRAEMSSRGLDLIDGRGGDRIVQAMSRISDPQSAVGSF